MNPLEQIKKAFHTDDAENLRGLLDEHPELKAKVNDPIGDFGAPAVLNVRSREMLDVLLDAGADINAKSDWWAGGFGILHSAPPELCAYALERGAVVDIHAAARLGMIDEVRELVAMNPDLVHERGGDGQLPLHFASTVEIAELLLDHGADIDARDIDHESTAAQWMTENRHEIVRFLISRGCRTDLLLAAAVGDLDLVRRTLDADPESIRMRVSDAYFPMVGGEAGGTIYQWTLGWYVSAHQVARKFSHQDVLDLLVARSPDDVLLIDACWMGDEASARELIKGHPHFRREDLKHAAYAARENAFGPLRLFLEAGLPVDGKSQHQATPLHWAAFHGNPEMVRLLLNIGAPLEERDADFDGTPLSWAIYGSEHGWNCRSGDYGGTVETLLEAGAHPPDGIAGSAAVQDVLKRWGSG